MDLDPAVGAEEGGAMTFEGAVAFFPGAEVVEFVFSLESIGAATVVEDDTIGGGELDVPGDGGVTCALGGDEATAFDGGNTFDQGRVAPEGDIEGVDAPTGDETEGVVGMEPPGFPRLGGRVFDGFAVGVRGAGSGAEPEIVVESLRDGGGIHGTAGLAGGSPDVDFLQCTDAPIADQFDGALEFATGPLLGAELEDALVLTDGSAEELVFGDSQAHGFFQVDVLAGAGGGDRHRDVPMVRGGDEHGVDVGSFEDLAEVVAGGAGGVAVMAMDAVTGLVSVAEEDIADGGDAGLGDGEDTAHDALALGADADGGDLDAGVGGATRAAAEGGGGEESGAGGDGQGGSEGGLEKGPTRHRTGAGFHGCVHASGRRFWQWDCGGARGRQGDGGGLEEGVALGDDAGGEAVELAADGMSALVDEGFKDVGGFGMTLGVVVGGREVRGSDGLVELEETFDGELGDGGADDVGEGIDALMESIGDKVGVQLAAEFSEIAGFEIGVGKETFQEAVLADPRLVNAGLLAVGGGADPAEFTPGMVQIPGGESEAFGDRVEPEEEVLAVAEDAVVVGEEDFGGEETGGGVEVEVVSEVLMELGILGVGYELAEVEEALSLGCGDGSFGVVDGFVGVPMGAEVGEEFEGDGFEEGGIRGGKGGGDPGGVGVFDDQVEAEEAALPLVGAGEEEAEEGGAGGGDANVAKVLVTEGVGEEGAIGGEVMKIEGALSGEGASGGMPVEVDFERTSVGADGIEEGAITFIADADVGDEDAAEFEVGGGPGEIEAEHAGDTGSGGQGIAEVWGAVRAEPVGQGRDAMGLEGGPFGLGEGEVGRPDGIGLEEVGGGEDLGSGRIGSWVRLDGVGWGYGWGLEFLTDGLFDEPLFDAGLLPEEPQGEAEGDQAEDQHQGGDQGEAKETKGEGWAAAGFGGR